MVKAESVIVVQHLVATSVQSSNAQKWTVLPTPKLGRLIARSHPAHVQVGAHERPVNTYNLHEAATAIDVHVHDDDDVGYRLTFDRWLVHHNRNMHAQPGHRAREASGHVRVLS